MPLHPLLLLTQTSPDPLPPPGPGFRSADHPKKFKQESNLERIGNHARELANDIESALFGEDDS